MKPCKAPGSHGNTDACKGRGSGLPLRWQWGEGVDGRRALQWRRLCGRRGSTWDKHSVGLTGQGARMV